MKNNLIVNPAVSLKEFIELNKKFCTFLKSINQMFEDKKIDAALAQIGTIESYSSAMENIKKSLPVKAELEKSKLFNELKSQQEYLKALMTETEHFVNLQVNLNKKVTNFLSIQVSEKIKNDSGYSKNGTISHSSNHSEFFAISDRI